MSEIYKNIIKIKKEEFLLFSITFFYVLFKNFFIEKFKYFYFLFFLVEIYLTVVVYVGIKRSVYNEDFKNLDIFKEGYNYFFPIFLYNLLIGLSGGIIYLILVGLINSIKTYSPYSIFLFVLIISWAAFPLFFLFLTLYTPFIIMIEKETVFVSMSKSVNFIKENLPILISLSFPFLIFWFLFFTIFQKYDTILPLKLILLCLMSLLEILTVKFIFLVYKGDKNERNV